MKPLLIKLGECSHSSSRDKFNTNFNFPAKIGSGTIILFQSHIPVTHSSGESSPVFRDTPQTASHISLGLWNGNETVRVLKHFLPTL